MIFLGKAFDNIIVFIEPKYIFMNFKYCQKFRKTINKKLMIQKNLINNGSII